MSHLIGISGSARKQSYNSALLRAAKEVMPAGSTLEIASIADIPLYNGDVEEASGVPACVSALKDRIAAADGLLMVTPEYNNAMPGVLKNAIDWLSRPPADIARVFRELPIAIIGASPGNFGTLLSQNSWLSVVRVLRMRPWLTERLTVSHANKVFDGDGKLADDAVREQLRTFVVGFDQFAGVARRPRGTAIAKG